MPRELTISIGQHSDRGRKDTNQDFHGALIPTEPLLSLKGIAVVIADGISSSAVSGEASESAVKSFLTDYYCTSESWSVKTSAQRVIAATNSWLQSQTQRGRYHYDKDRGYVCTLSAMVIRARAAHVFHVGDSRIYRVSDRALEQLTTDHRVVISSEQSYLARALGVNPQIEIDYQALQIDAGDVYVLATDGVYDFVGARFITSAIADHAGDLDAAARLIVDEAYAQNSPDNLTVQIVRIDAVPDGEASDILMSQLPLPPLLEARMTFDGYGIVRELHGSSRSHIYLAVDVESGEQVVIKIPSIDLRDDPVYLKRFMIEEWVARRIDSAHVLKPCRQSRKRNYLYIVAEFIEGQTLKQWMLDNPKPDLETVRGITEQIARGLQAFHRMEMIHQDIRPDNIMIDKTGTVKIIDFGSTRVNGVAEADSPGKHSDILGTPQYTAPELFFGKRATSQSDLYALGTLTYQMLSGTLPYGAEVAKATNAAQHRKLRYRSLLNNASDIPEWIDGVLRKAVHADPAKRYDELSEYVYDLRNPKAEFLNPPTVPLLERNPNMVWKGLSLLLAITVIVLLSRR
ncbi:bifunctional protein-serine/threonine kinase/phosphatase [Tardiphaga robiniae]|uniref:Bifunctional protein-serine/threonine kinase/phosphatase n=1 Tax=Tardiphaga robiniae TaxID=943830 RepID=A0A7G6U2T7_9BRAD|nr:bifunctional protein-serine/threonine kinase/phosphatase [Tardiphaga robiniae]QND73319.1 bifunctional protein-serine/threonine kinase/phosphatase [Tardiphaga robiniae]